MENMRKRIKIRIAKNQKDFLFLSMLQVLHILVIIFLAKD